MTQLQSEAAVRRTRRVGSVGNRGSVWPEAHQEKLRKMWLRGSPIKLIAHELGRSQRSVVGMRLKMGLLPRKRPGQVRGVRMSLHLSDQEWRGVVRAASNSELTVVAYMKNLLRRDGAL